MMRQGDADAAGGGGAAGDGGGGDGGGTCGREGRGMMTSHAS